MECQFLYFGISFLVETHRLSTAKTSLPTTFVSLQMRRVIEEEDELLRKTFGRLVNKVNEPKEFVQVKPGLFLYCSDMYIKMSSVTLTFLQRCGVRFEQPIDAVLEQCSQDDHHSHDGYLPFFHDNNSLVHIYNETISRITSDKLEEVQRASEVMKYQQQLRTAMATKQHKKTRFHTNGLPTTRSWDLAKNEWTERLSHCLPMYFPQNVTFNSSYNDGQIFKDYQALYSETTFSKMYTFHGAPDMILSFHGHQDKVNLSDDNSNNSLVNVEMYEETDSSGTDDGTTEMEKQGSVVNELLDLPEKLGKVIAGLHFLLIAKVLRTYTRKKTLMTEVTAKGCLVDKSNGVIHCCVVAKVRSPEEREMITTSFICCNGMLSGSTLCKQLHEVIKT